MGVKQSGDRLFQLNNLKRKIVDELFRLVEFCPTPSLNGGVLPEKSLA
ncbi:TPA: hypothetical protein U2C39_000067 [Streptococcus suis]|nr:hypothetical protein [Streptococcus suis]